MSESTGGRFAILRHDWPSPHWDLFLEEAENLRSWRLLADPTASPCVLAEIAAPHRKAYLDYEGLVSGDRGTVTALDRGRFEYLDDGPGRVAVRLSGTVFQREFEIVADKDGLQFRWLV